MTRRCRRPGRAVWNAGNAPTAERTETVSTTLQAERRDASVRGRTGFRLDIQALRALAVLLVVVGHAWPTRLPGGYVGVDVFFVISGFLITSHLLKELAAQGRIRLAHFYARRVRRLLPAAFLVLAVSLIAVFVWLPPDRWARNAAEIAASAGYVENWVLAALSVDYSAVNASASVAQHYWSLSVEEQFYLVWPWLLIAGAALVFRKRQLRARIVTIIGALVALSFTASLLSTALTPQPAYFQTFTRAWEFGVGALVALLALQLHVATRWALSFAGWAAIGASAVLFTATTPMPGAAALLPVLGTAAVLVAGTDANRPPLHHVVGLWPVQWLGKISYSLYLWHWPVIVILPFVIGHDLTFAWRVMAVIVSIFAAVLTFLLVESPAQRAAGWSTSNRRTFAAMALGMVLVFGAATGVGLSGSSLTAAASARAMPTGPCAGPMSLVNTSECGSPRGGPIETVMSEDNAYYAGDPACSGLDELMVRDKVTTAHCDFSPGEPTATVWIVGDSHAEQWKPVIFALARERDWDVTYSLLGGCAVSDAAWTGFRSIATASAQADCRTWSADVITAVTEAAPDYVFTSQAAPQQFADDGSGRSAFDQFVDGFTTAWSGWQSAGITVVPIIDAPLNGRVRSADCVTLNAMTPGECDRPRSEALPADPQLAAANNTSLSPLDMTDTFCDADVCWAAAGGIPVYFDADHLNRAYTLAMLPLFTERFDAATR